MEMDSEIETTIKPISIGDYNCNINRTPGETLVLLQNFSDAIPYYNDKYGAYLELLQKNSEPIIIPLSDNVLSGLLIKNSKDMNRKEYMSAFVAKKKDFIENVLVRRTYCKGYETPSPVQALCIPELIQRKDALVQFKSGTGKTHAFLFGCLWGFDPDDSALQYLFITSSHEVAIQIYEQAKFLLSENTKISLCIGRKKDNSVVSGDFKTAIGTSSLAFRQKTIKEEMNEVKSAQIIVGTMGKLYDFMINKKWINTNYLKAICIDEFDNIIASPSRRSSSTYSTSEQIARIIEFIPSDAQRAFFSATVSGEAYEIATNYFRKNDPSIGEPFIILLDMEDYTLEGIRQYYVQCISFSQKKDTLLDLLSQCRIAQGIIFVNRIETAKEIYNFLNEKSFPSTAVFHGDLPESVRNQIHKDFRNNKIRILISTDVTARGFDVQGINVVINFDMPNDFEVYVHRIGRSGRHGKKGVSISFILVNNKYNETSKITTINERSSRSPITELPGDLASLL